MKKYIDRHKKADSIKWWLTLIAFIVVGVMLTGIITGRINVKSKKDDKALSPAVDNAGNEMQANKLYSMPESMSFSSRALNNAFSANENGISVTIYATVYPDNASNKEVDYSLLWGNAPTYGQNAVTDYVTVTQESDGSNVATVTCYKSFGNDTIVLIVKTRDGGFTDSCVISFIGVATELKIVSTMDMTNDSSRGDYYALETGETYTFDISLGSNYDSVGDYNLSTKLGGSGELYFATYIESYDGSECNFSWDYRLQDCEDLVNKFIVSAEINDTTLTIVTSSTWVENYYSSSENAPSVNGTRYRERYVFFDEGNKVTKDDAYIENSNFNKTNITRCYFTIEVTDEISGLSDEIRVWVEPSVTGVSLSEEALEF